MRKKTPQPHRDRYDIANDILHIVCNAPILSPRHKTGIGCAVSINHKQTAAFLRGLTDLGLLQISYEIGQYSHFEITERGIRYLQLFAEIEDDMKPVSLAR